MSNKSQIADNNAKLQEIYKIVSNRQDKTITPGTEDQTVEADAGGILGTVTATGDANFVEGNIKSGVSLWGKTGTHKGIADIANGAEASYVSKGSDIESETFVEIEKTPLINDDTQLSVVVYENIETYGSGYKIYPAKYHAIRGNDGTLRITSTNNGVIGKLGVNGDSIYLDEAKIINTCTQNTRENLSCMLSDDIIASIGKINGNYSSTGLSVWVSGLSISENSYIIKANKYVGFDSDDGSTTYEPKSIVRVSDNRFAIMYQQLVRSGSNITTTNLLGLFEYSSGEISQLDTYELTYSTSYGYMIFDLPCGAFLAFSISSENKSYFSPLTNSDNSAFNSAFNNNIYAMPFSLWTHGRDVLEVSVTQIGDSNNYLFTSCRTMDSQIGHGETYYAVASYNGDGTFSYSAVNQLSDTYNVTEIASIDGTYFAGIMRSAGVCLMKLSGDGVLTILSTFQADLGEYFYINHTAQKYGLFTTVIDGVKYVSGIIGFMIGGLVNTSLIVIRCGSSESKIKPATSRIDGVTISKATATQPGKVMVLR